MKRLELRYGMWPTRDTHIMTTLGLETKLSDSQKKSLKKIVLLNTYKYDPQHVYSTVPSRNKNPQMMACRNCNLTFCVEKMKWTELLVIDIPLSQELVLKCSIFYLPCRTASFHPRFIEMEFFPSLIHLSFAFLRKKEKTGAEWSSFSLPYLEHANQCHSWGWLSGRCLRWQREENSDSQTSHNSIY